MHDVLLFSTLILGSVFSDYVVFCGNKLISEQSDLLSSLCRDDNVKLINSVRWSRELAGVAVVGAADVGDDAIKQHVSVVDDWTHVLRQTDKERCTATRTRRTFIEAKRTDYQKLKQTVVNLISSKLSANGV